MNKKECSDKNNEVSTIERLYVPESVLYQLRKEEKKTPPLRQQLIEGSKALLKNYQREPEMCIFTQLDGEPYHC